MGLFPKKKVSPTHTEKALVSVESARPGVFSVIAPATKYSRTTQQHPDTKTMTNSSISSNHSGSITSPDTAGNPCSSSQSEKSGRIQIVIPKTSSGFGFTLKDTELVRVNRVKDGGSAHAAGLRRGDVICAINGQDVRHEKSTTIARIVRRSRAHIVLDICRFRTESRSSSPSCQSLQSRTRPSCYGRPLPDIPREAQSVMSSLMRVPKRANASHPGPPPYTDNRNDSSTNWRPDISNIPGEFEDESANIYEEINDISTVRPDVEVELSSAKTNIECSDSNSSQRPCTTTNNVTSAAIDASWNHSVLNQSSSTEELECLGNLMSTEAAFVHQMHGGVYAYTRPLRHHILSAYQHHILFQNIEQLVILSERCVNRIANTEIDLNMEEIYGKQIHAMCDAYLIYMSGLPAALRMREQLLHDAEFERFLHLMDQRREPMSLEAFLEQPVRHFLEVLATIKRLADSLKTESLTDIVQCMVDALRQSIDHEMRSSTSSLDSGYGWSSEDETSSRDDDVSRVYDNAPQSSPDCSQPLLSVVGRTTSMQRRSRISGCMESSPHHGNIGGNYDLHKSGIDCSIDAQLAKLQNRLYTAADTKPFKLAVPGRHLVFSGDLKVTTKSGEVQDVRAWLCSDLLLLTRDATRGYHIVCQPIHIAHIVDFDFSDLSCKFRLRMHGLFDHGLDFTDAVSLEAGSYEDKCVWKNIVLHQARLVSAQPIHV